MYGTVNRGRNSAYYTGIIGNYRQTHDYNYARSNTYSPTYSLGLTEVLASRAPGTFVLSLEQPRRPSSSCQYFCNLKIKQLIFILVGFLVFSAIAITFLNSYMNSKVLPFEFVKNQYDDPQAKSNEMNSGAIPETLPKIPTISDDEFKNESTSHDMKPPPPPPVTTARPEKKMFNVVYSFDDANDDEVHIEDVFM